MRQSAASYWSALGKGSTLSNIACDVQGRFEIPLNYRHIAKVALDVTGTRGLGARHLEPVADFEHDVDLGDLALAPTRTVSFSVLDVFGAPVAGAVAVAGVHNDVDTDIVSPPTDAKGESSLRIDASTSAMRVGALGYAVADVPIPATVMAQLHVTLVRWQQADHARGIACGTHPAAHHAAFQG